MKAKEWLGVMQQAADYDHNMTKLIEKYGEMLVNEEVERRIQERLPSEEEVDKHADKTIKTRHTYDEFHDGMNVGFKDGCQWLRSRLTENKQEGEKPKSEKPVCPNCKTSAFVDSAGYNSWGCNKCDSTWMNGGKAWEGGEG